MIQTFRVDEEHCIDLAGLVLLSTPHLIWELEHAAIELLQNSLDEGEISLGIHLNLEHRSPATVGDEVRCRAKVVHREGPLVTFQISAEANGQVLTQGLHKRRVVRAERVQARLDERQSVSSASLS